MPRGRPALTVEEVPIGSRFGRWVTTSPPYLASQGPSSKPCSYIDVRCDCGTVGATRPYLLRNGQSKSCGCLSRELSIARSGPNSASWKGSSGAIAQKIAWLYQEKSSPCTDCGQSFPAKMMQFDHVPGRGEKKFQLSIKDVMAKRTLEVLRAERAKCDLVCPNCHWLRTLSRYGNSEDPSVIYPEPPEETENEK